jgi:acetoin utilization protein AcuB
MTTKLIKIGMDQTIGELRQTLEQHPVHHLLVFDKNKLVGILSDRDVLNATTPFNGTRNETSQDETLLRRRVHQIMTRHLITIQPDSPIGDAAAVMLAQGVSCLPVVDDSGKTLGIISMRGLLKHYMTETVLTA